MNNKMVIVIAVVAVIVIGSAIGIASAVHNSKNDDSKYVIYYGNGEIMGDGSSVLKSTNTTVKAADEVFNSTDKFFIVWNTKADGTGDKYVPGKKVDLGTELYAIWSEYRINFGNVRHAAGELGLTMTVSNDLYDDIPGNLVGLDDSGKIRIVLSDWVTLDTNHSTTFFGNVPAGYFITMFPEADGATATILTVDGTDAIIDIEYDNTRDVDASTMFTP